MDNPFGPTRKEMINGIQDEINKIVRKRDPSTAEMLAVASSMLVSLHKAIGGPKEKFLILLSGVMTVASGTEEETEAMLKQMKATKKN